MTSYRGIEGVLDTAIAYILANQAAKLAEVEALDWTNPLDMPSFVGVRMCEPYWGEGDYPVLFAVPLNDEPRPAAGGGTVAAFDRVQWVALAGHSGTADLLPADAAMRLAGRYIRAVRAMLKDLHSHPARPQHWQLGRMVYNKNYTRQSGEWLADAQLQTAIEYTEG